MATGNWMLVLELYLIFTGSASAQSCEPMSACSVRLSTGKDINFCDVFSQGDLRADYTQGYIVYNALEGVICDTTVSNQALCLYLSTGSSYLHYGLGEAAASQMSCSVSSMDPGSNTYNIYIEYLKGESGRSSIIDLMYNGGGTLMTSFLYQSSGNNKYYLSLSTKGSDHKQPTNDAAGSWVSWVFIALVIVSVAGYFVIGMLVKWKWKGARGVEMVPNINFWKSFPFLVKDGVVFTFTAWPCCKNININLAIAYTKV